MWIACFIDSPFLAHCHLHPHPILREERHHGSQRNPLLRRERQMGALEQSRQDEDRFHLGELIADANARPTAKGEESVLGHP